MEEYLYACSHLMLQPFMVSGWVCLDMAESPTRNSDGQHSSSQLRRTWQDRCAEGSGSVIQGTDPRIRICTKMCRIWNTASHAIGGGPFLVPYYVMFACGWDLAELWMRSRRVWMRPSRGWMRSNRVWMRSKRLWIRSSTVVRKYDCQCRSRKSPGLDPSILWHTMYM